MGRDRQPVVVRASTEMKGAVLEDIFTSAFVFKLLFPSRMALISAQQKTSHVS